MLQFHYRAIGTDGHPTDGVLHAASILEAAKSLEKQGMRVIDLQSQPIAATTKVKSTVPSGPIQISRAPAPPKPTPQAPIAHRAAPSTAPAASTRPINWRPWTWDLLGIPLQAQQQFFFVQLHKLVAANVPLVQALTTLEKNTTSKKLQQIANQMAKNAAAGKPISDAFDAFPNCISPVIVNTIRAGEAGGYLEIALKEVVDDLNTGYSPLFAIDRTMRTILVWFLPLAIVYATIMLFFNWQLRGAGFYPGYFWESYAARREIRLILFLAVAFFFVVSSNNPRFSKIWNSVLSSGANAGMAAEIRFARALSHLLASGMELSTAFEYAVKAATNDRLEAVLLPQVQALRNGESLADVLQRTGVCSRFLVDFVRTGETSGTLPESLENVAAHLELEASSRRRSWMARRWYI